MHRQIFDGDETVDYAFMGQDADAADNRWLREAMEHQVPIVYFLGIAPGRYQAIVPTYIAGWDPQALKARIAFGAAEQETLTAPESSIERRYALRAVKQRLHQASFREAVITAYNGRCALSGLRESLLLDAAHIIADKNELLGQPVGHAAAIGAGEFIQASGRWVNDRTHGVQFRTNFLRAAPPTTAEGIEKYLASGMIKGIGPIYARKLVKVFREQVFDVSSKCRHGYRTSTASAQSAPRASSPPGPIRRRALRSASILTDEKIAPTARRCRVQRGQLRPCLELC